MKTQALVRLRTHVVSDFDAGRLTECPRALDITWQPKEGLLDASGFHATGNPEWHSYIRMSREYTGTVIGHYNNVNSIHGGIQQVIYSKQNRSFHVMGTSRARKCELM